MIPPRFHLPRRDEGTARETLIIIHGLGGRGRLEEKQLYPLTREYNVIIPNLPGLIDSTEFNMYTVDRALSSLLQIIDQVGAHPVHLCGISLGAFIAIHATLIRQYVIRSLMLFGGDVNPNPILMLAQPAPAGLATKNPHQLSPLIDAYEEEYVHMLEAAGREGGVPLPPQNASPFQSTRDALSLIQVKTLVVCGERDFWNRRAAQELAKSIPDAVLRILPGLGHIWYQEKPDVFTQLVERFLQRLGQ
jgi:pimeloyl-ACP methyl ester carboxylesterase